MATTTFYMRHDLTEDITPTAQNQTWISISSAGADLVLHLTRASSGNDVTTQQYGTTGSSNDDYRLWRLTSPAITVEKSIAYGDGLQVMVYAMEEATQA